MMQRLTFPFPFDNELIVDWQRKNCKKEESRNQRKDLIEHTETISQRSLLALKEGL